MNETIKEIIISLCVGIGFVVCVTLIVHLVIG